MLFRSGASELGDTPLYLPGTGDRDGVVVIPFAREANFLGRHFTEVTYDGIYDELKIAERAVHNLHALDQGTTRIRFARARTLEGASPRLRARMLDTPAGLPTTLTVIQSRASYTRKMLTDALTQCRAIDDATKADILSLLSGGDDNALAELLRELEEILPPGMLQKSATIGQPFAFPVECESTDATVPYIDVQGTATEMDRCAYGPCLGLQGATSGLVSVMGAGQPLQCAVEALTPYILSGQVAIRVLEGTGSADVLEQTARARRGTLIPGGGSHEGAWGERHTLTADMRILVPVATDTADVEVRRWVYEVRSELVMLALRGYGPFEYIIQVRGDAPYWTIPSLPKGYGGYFLPHIDGGMLRPPLCGHDLGGGVSLIHLLWPLSKEVMYAAPTRMALAQVREFFENGAPNLTVAVFDGEYPLGTAPLPRYTVGSLVPVPGETAQKWLERVTTTGSGGWNHHQPPPGNLGPDIIIGDTIGGKNTQTGRGAGQSRGTRSEEHTSELQSP